MGDVPDPVMDLSDQMTGSDSVVSIGLKGCSCSNCPGEDYSDERFPANLPSVVGIDYQSGDNLFGGVQCGVSRWESVQMLRLCLDSVLR